MPVSLLALCCLSFFAMVIALVVREGLLRRYTPKSLPFLNMTGAGTDNESAPSATRRHAGVLGAVSRRIEQLLPIARTDAAQYRDRLAAAGLKMEPTTWRAGIVLSIFVGATFLGGLVGGSIVGVSVPARIAMVVGGGVLGWIAPQVFLFRMTATRRREIETQLPDAIGNINIVITAGASIEQCFREVASVTDGALAEEFARVDKEINFVGHSREQALFDMDARCKSADVSAFCRTIIQASKDGCGVATILADYADLARQEASAAQLERVEKMGTKLTLLFGFTFLPMLIVLIMAPLAYQLLGFFNNGLF